MKSGRFHATNFSLFRRGGQGGGGGGFSGMGGMGGGGPMEFGKSKSKFQEVPETGITFDDVAVSLPRIYTQISPAIADCRCLGS